jgi:hypothetical protein
MGCTSPRHRMCEQRSQTCTPRAQHECSAGTLVHTPHVVIKLPSWGHGQQVHHNVHDACRHPHPLRRAFEHQLWWRSRASLRVRVHTQLPLVVGVELDLKQLGVGGPVAQFGVLRGTIFAECSIEKLRRATAPGPHTHLYCLASRTICTILSSPLSLASPVHCRSSRLKSAAKQINRASGESAGNGASAVTAQLLMPS